MHLNEDTVFFYQSAVTEMVAMVDLAVYLVIVQESLGKTKRFEMDFYSLVKGRLEAATTDENLAKALFVDLQYQLCFSPF